MAAEQPALCRSGGGLRRLPGGPGAANALFAAKTAGGPVVLKIRRDPLDDGSRETWGLRRAGEVGPALLAVATPDALRERAPDTRARRALDLDVGAVLVLERLPGAPAAPPTLDEAELEAVGRLIARLHDQPLGTTRRAPSLASAPQALATSAAELFDVLQGAAGVSAPLVRRLRRRWREVHRGVPSKRARRSLCHGDLRWHNLLASEQGFRLIDFEHAGVGDAAFDLALFSARTPLSEHQELAVLDAYLDARGGDGGLVDRFFALKPAAVLIGALAGAVDLLDVRDGHRPVFGAPADVVDARGAAVDAALTRALGEPVSLRLPRRRKARGRR